MTRSPDGQSSLKLLLQYDGTDYVGWQRQAQGASIQGLVEDAMAPLERRPVTVIGAGRTDAGVHALGQVASVVVRNTLDPQAILRALNAALPADVRVAGVERAPDGFHAQYDARAKHYRYRILNAEVATPFERRYAWHLRQPLDEEAMAAAAALLVGGHDFAAFRGAGSDVQATGRTVSVARLARGPIDPLAGAAPLDRTAASGSLLTLDIAADGFLRHMVRAIVGTLVEVGSGRRAAADIARVLESRDRSQAGPTAPAHGLCLVRVEYAPDGAI